MYFTKVELHNFGIYKGTHEMCLTDQIGNRNITLVGGLNGRGKTTFHDSILIALWQTGIEIHTGKGSFIRQTSA